MRAEVLLKRIHCFFVSIFKLLNGINILNFIAIFIALIGLLKITDTNNVILSINNLRIDKNSNYTIFYLCPFREGITSLNIPVSVYFVNKGNRINNFFLHNDVEMLDFSMDLPLLEVGQGKFIRTVSNQIIKPNIKTNELGSQYYFAQCSNLLYNSESGIFFTMYSKCIDKKLTDINFSNIIMNYSLASESIENTNVKFIPIYGNSISDIHKNILRNKNLKNFIDKDKCFYQETKIKYLTRQGGNDSLLCTLDLVGKIKRVD